MVKPDPLLDLRSAKMGAVKRATAEYFDRALAAAQAVKWVLAFVFQQGDADRVGPIAIKDDIGEILELDTAVAGMGMIKRVVGRAGLDRGQAGTEFGFETVSEMHASLRLIVGDRFIEVRLDCGMEGQRHFRARRAPAQNASSVSGLRRPDSSSASRRTASARISAGSLAVGGGGRLPRSLSARWSRSLSGRRRAAASMSASLVMTEI